jgi:hypothetical protein
MPANTYPIFALVPHNEGVTFTDADTTDKKTVCTPGANGSRIDGIFVCTNDTAAVNLAFYINDGAADLYIGNVVVPIGSGYTSVVRVEALNTLRPLGMAALCIPDGCLLKCNCVATMTAGKVTTVVAIGGDF